MTKNTRYDIVNTHKEKRQENSRNKQNNRYLTKYQIGCIIEADKNENKKERDSACADKAGKRRESEIWERNI